MKNNHIMIDLETLSTQPNAHILSIGAVAFSMDKGIVDEFYYCLGIGKQDRHVSLATVAWWMGQSLEARKVFEDPLDGCLPSALMRLHDFCSRSTLDGVCSRGTLDGVWAKGPSFDLVILENAYKQYGINCPWPFWAHRDVRTIEFIFQSMGGLKSVLGTKRGTAHNALDDARVQAQDVIGMMRFIDQVNNKIE